MKKVSNILLLIGEILAIVNAVTALIVGVAFILLVNPVFLNQIRDAIVASDSTIPGETVDLIMSSIQMSFIITGASCIIGVIPSIIAAVFSHKSRHDFTQTNLIVTLVMAYLGGINVLIAGAIVGIIAYVRENK